MAKKVNIKTISGLLQILGDNIDSLNQNSSADNIKKSNAILQNVNAIRGIYSLAFSQARLKAIEQNDSPFGEAFGKIDLLGSVTGEKDD